VGTEHARGRVDEIGHQGNSRLRVQNVQAVQIVSVKDYFNH
jgi:hypothetical protein